MRNRFALVLVWLPVLTACGGSNRAVAPATSAASGPSSHLSLAAGMPGDQPYDVTGPAFAQYMPSTKLLEIFVVDPASQPAPISCAMIGLAGNFKSGGMASVGFKSPTGAPQTGTFPVMQSGYMIGDIAKQELRTGGSVPDDSSLVVSNYDAKHLEAEVKTPDGKTVGVLHAKVCPDDALGVKMQQQLQVSTSPAVR